MAQEQEHAVVEAAGHSRAKRRRQTRQREVPAAGPVTTTTVDPAAWQQALSAADGDHRRLVRVDENTVLVLNTPP